MDVSIIIVNYNTVNLIINAVDSIIEKTEGINYEIIIVDNNSTDNAEIILKERYNDKVKFIASPDNLGFGRANNLGLEFAEGRNILFLNPDTILINNAIKILSDHLDMNVETGICGGNLYDIHLSPTYSYQRWYPSFFSELNEFSHGLLGFIRGGKNRYFNNSDEPLTVAYIVGADLMIKSQLLKKLGNFNSKFFMYYEETELCFRVKKSGYKIMCIPNAKIIHLEGGSFDKPAYSSKRMEMMLTGREIFFSICYSPNYKKIVNLSQLFQIRFMLLVSYLFNKNEINFWKTKYTLFKQISK